MNSDVVEHTQQIPTEKLHERLAEAEQEHEQVRWVRETVIWHYVTYRLPKRGEMVCVSAGAGFVPEVGYLAGGRWHDKYGKRLSLEIIAWAYLRGPRASQ